MLNAIANVLSHADSWVNAAIGFGGARDKTSYTTFCGIVTKLTDVSDALT